MSNPEGNVLAWLDHDLHTIGPVKAPTSLRQRLVLIESLVRDLPPDMAGPVLVWQDDHASRRHKAVTERIVIGRSPDADVVLNSAKVSRRHCEIVLDDQIQLADLDSLNGTRLNGTPIGRNRVCLKHGDLIEVGPHVLLYLGHEEMLLAHGNNTG